MWYMAIIWCINVHVALFLPPCIGLSSSPVNFFTTFSDLSLSWLQLIEGLNTMADQKRILQEGFSFVLWYLLEFYMLSTLTWHYELNIPIISNSLGQRESLVQWVTWWSWICLWWKYPRLVGAKWIFLGRRHAQTHKVAPNCRSNLSWWYNCLWRYVFSLLRWTIVSSLWEVHGWQLSGPFLMKPLKRAAVTVIIAYVVFICSQNCRKVPQGGKIRLDLLSTR